KGEISEGHARSILALDNDVDKMLLWKRITSENLSVRRTEEPPRAASPASPRVLRVGQAAALEPAPGQPQVEGGRAAAFADARDGGAAVVGCDDLEVGVDLDRECDPVALVGGVEHDRAWRARCPVGQARGHRAGQPRRQRRVVVPAPAQPQRRAEEDLAQRAADEHEQVRQSAGRVRPVGAPVDHHRHRFVAAGGMGDQPLPAEVLAPAEAAEVVVVVAEPAVTDRRRLAAGGEPTFGLQLRQQPPADEAAAERGAIGDEQRRRGRGRVQHQLQLEVGRRDAQREALAVEAEARLVAVDGERPRPHHPGLPRL
ncbi:MAG: hypothetical protein J0L57_02245, partial [Burkholderiales bacterium]|nr:hypothetical protein [Burkholderiales bacterium]